ncbi:MULTISPECIES: LytTR family DNA-binding domain-containing protein [unclassified Brevundimonas]|uniref:LytTR family DNA-binding domain-containing protein n=1 Tax=unclassified Brevundimonas TaxID=2622653 RepID=UPI0025B85230|nr:MULTISPECIES: LytTR family DNA-binding domain-containing protein [unclassified Brevundimonas]
MKAVTNGKLSVMNGAAPKDLWRGGGLIVLGAVLVVAVNTLTTLWDMPDAKRWEPLVWEVSSLIGLVAALWVPWLSAAKAPADEVLAAGWKPKLHFITVHVVALFAYSLLHVGVFVLVRRLAYSLAGQVYTLSDGFWFEFRKDLLSYMLFLSVFWAVTHVRRNARDEVRPVSFDIRDGARIIRVPLADILAVTAAGNYVEFLLADGRRPLMRATMAAVEARLAPVGFVRSHRSWLVNPDHMTGLEPAGSGDWTVSLGAVEAPVSRRYPQALERLRA